MALVQNPADTGQTLDLEVLEQRATRAAKLAIPYACLCAFGYLSAYLCVADDMPTKVALLAAFLLTAFMASLSTVAEYIRIAEPRRFAGNVAVPLKIYEHTTVYCGLSLLAMAFVLVTGIASESYFGGENYWKKTLAEVQEAARPVHESFDRLQTCRENREVELRTFDASAPASRLSKDRLVRMRQAIVDRCAHHEEDVAAAGNNYKMTLRKLGFDPEEVPKANLPSAAPKP